jgi:3-hydroxyacyl-CoA dehydrogenase
MKIAVVGSGLIGTGVVTRVLYAQGVSKEIILVEQKNETMNKENVPLHPYPAGPDIELAKTLEEQAYNDAGKGIRARNARRKRDRNRVGGHGTNFTPSKKKRKK